MMKINSIKVAGLVVLTFAGLTGCSPKKGSAPQMMPMVTVAKPVVSAVTNWDEYPGHIESIEYVEIRARVSGYIDSIHFEDGAEVKAGDLLFVIDPKPFEAELERAKGELAKAKAALDQARANKQQAETRLELAKNDLQRAEGLLATKAISEEEYDLRSKNYREAQAALEAASAGIVVAESAIQSAQAAVRIAELNLDYTRVIAPVNGRIGRRLVTVGNLVQSGGAAPGTVLATIVSVDPIYCYFDVDERAFLKYRKLAISKDGKLVLPCEVALDGEDGFPHKGTIDFTDNKINPTTGTIKLRGIFQNKDRALIPGAFARIRLPVEKIDSAILIPEAAILAEQTRKYVYVLNKEQVVEPRPIVLGPAQGMQRVILQGLTPDDNVVTSGLLMLRPGVKVQVVEPGKGMPPGMSAGMPPDAGKAMPPAGQKSDAPEKPANAPAK